MRIPYKNLIDGSRKTIILSVELQDTAHAVEYTQRIYKSCNKRGMYKTVQKQARTCATLAKKHGLTAEKPVMYKREGSGIRAYGLIFGVDFLVPLFSARC